MKMEKTEKIGNLTLDLTDYPGEDFYSEGEAEDVLLDIVRNHPVSEYNHQIMAHPNWSTLYHLSDLRGNIVDFIPLKKSHKVLEVGSGCGAITAALAKSGAQITCVELSKKRSLVNANRNKEYGNVTIKVGNFQDVEKRLDQDYDYVMLIGVLEYAASYIRSKKPYEEFLRILSGHLKKGGKMIIAIENKYGLKYFAGCREDHLGSFFSGIEGYKENDGVRTFSRPSLCRLLEDAGFSSRFYYPYPDYKLPVTIYSDERLPKRGEISAAGFNFDRDRLKCFDEAAAFNELIDEGQFSFFSNSFLLEAVKGEGFDEERVIYSKHSNERAAAYAIRTDITALSGQKFTVRKYPLTPEAVSHIRSLGEKYELLKEQYKNTVFEPNRFLGGEGCAEFEYISADTTLEDELAGYIMRGEDEKALSLIDEYVLNLKLMADPEGYISVSNIDLIFSNLIPGPEKWTVLDYEWTFDEKKDYRFILFRAIKYFVMNTPEASRLKLYERYEISDGMLERFEKQEKEFQTGIAGGRLSLVAFDGIFGQAAYPADQLYSTVAVGGRLDRAKVYFDCGEGFSEGNCCYVTGVIKDSDKLNIDITLPKGIKNIRIDPSDHRCVIKLIRADKEQCLVNGIPLDNGVIYYPEEDPQMIFEGVLSKKETFHIEYRIELLSKDFREEISSVIKKYALKNNGFFARKGPYEKVRI